MCLCLHTVYSGTSKNAGAVWTGECWRCVENASVVWRALVQCEKRWFKNKVLFKTAYASMIFSGVSCKER